MGGLLLSQAAYRGGLAAPLAVVNLANPAAAAVIGVALLGETFRAGAWGWLAAAAASLVAARGVVLLTASAPAPPEAVREAAPPAATAPPTTATPSAAPSAEGPTGPSSAGLPGLPGVPSQARPEVVRVPAASGPPAAGLFLPAPEAEPAR
ncbi:hypothetical protein [Streptomyces filamentosus]